MRSSGSTRNRSIDGAVRLLLVIAEEDHPKACTGRRLVRRGLARALDAQRAPRPHPLLLDPHAERPLAPDDRPAAERGGLLGVDCSWNLLGERGEYPPSSLWLRSIPGRRRLPWLLAANPQHYGRLGELNTAEAFGASLYLLGLPEEAEAILAESPGGSSFLALNQAWLDRYLSARDGDEMLAAERELL